MERVRRRARYGQKRLKRISRTATLAGLFLSFLKIGTVGFGGGLAVIAQIRFLTVRKREWFTEHEFAEAFALAQSLPGTNAGNAVTYIGLRLRGWRGACAAMAGFILPSTLMMVGLAILYKHLHHLEEVERFFNGLNSAVVALILVTAWRIGGNTLVRRWQTALAVVSLLAVVALKATIIEVVLVAGLLGIYIDSFAERRFEKWRRVRRRVMRRRAELAELETKNFVGGYLTRAIAEERVRRSREQIENDASENGDSSSIDAAASIDNASIGNDADNAVQATRKRHGAKLRAHVAPVLLAAMPIALKLGLLLTLSSIFLRIGAVTFGGGFVMIPHIEAEVVSHHGWLTHQEFADATALGQITPGPVLITATFIGYRVAGTLGALCATVSVFLPAFLMTIAAGSSLRRFRSNRQVQAFLRGVTPAVVGLLVAAAWSIGRAGIHSWIGVAIALLCIAALLRFRINAVWIIFGAGFARFLVGTFMS